MDLYCADHSRPYHSGWEAKDGIVYIAKDYDNIRQEIALLGRIRSLPGIHGEYLRILDDGIDQLQRMARASMMSMIQIDHYGVEASLGRINTI